VGQQRKTENYEALFGNGKEEMGKNNIAVRTLKH